MTRQLSAKDEMKIRILTIAAKLIRERNRDVICGAINAAAYMLDDEVRSYQIGLLHDCKRELKNYIMGKLGEHTFYHSWLHANCAEFRKLPYIQADAAARAGRLEWIAYMIGKLTVPA